MEHLSAWIDPYLEMCEYEKNLSPDTLKAYRIDLKQFFTFANQDMVDLNLINQYIKYLNQNFSPRSVKRKLASIRAFFHEMEMSGKLLEHYCEAYAPEIQNAGYILFNRLGKPLSPQSVRRIIRAFLKSVQHAETRIFFRNTALIFLEIHKGFLRQIALSCEKICFISAY